MERDLRHELRQDGECGSLAESLSAYVDGAVESIEAGRVEDHLRQCLACSRTLEELRRLDADVRSVVAVPPPPGLWARLAPAPRPAARSSWWLFLPRILLALYDGELAARPGWRRGSARGPDRVVLASGIALGASACWLGGTAGAMSAAVALPLLWLASLRLDERWGAAGLLVPAFLAALPCFALDPTRGLAPAGAVAALAVCQWLEAPRLRVRMAGRSVPSGARAAGMVALAFVIARPDLAGAWALAPVLSGAGAGALATSIRRAA